MASNRTAAVPATAPVLFISHGAPTFALEPGELGQQLGTLGQSLSGIRAFVVVSPHWQTRDLRVSAHPAPQTIHDFYGFAPALYELQYPAAGAPEAAQEVVTALIAAGMPAIVDREQGMDHGVWVPLMHLRPQADIPVICVSLPIDATPESAYRMGKALAPLRQRGMLVIGSGSLTHNLMEFRGGLNTNASGYVTEFVQWMRDAVASRTLAPLLDYRNSAPHAVIAHPTDEHLLPLQVAFGASDQEDHLDVITTEVRYGMLSMESYLWRATSLA